MHELRLWDFTARHAGGVACFLTVAGGCFWLSLVRAVLHPRPDRRTTKRPIHNCLYAFEFPSGSCMNGLLGVAMAPRTRRVVQALLYETVAIALVTPAIAILFEQGKGSALGLSVLMSSIALAWNYTFNAMFEWWEQRQSVKGRSSLRRLVHGIGFEGGLGLLLIPVMALWLHIGLWEAVLTELGFLLFFMGYTVAFTWSFDHLFGLPESAR